MKRTPPNLKSAVRNPKSERIPLVAPQLGGGGKPEIRVGACKFLAGVIMGVLLVANAAWANYATPYTFTTIAGTNGTSVEKDGTNSTAQFYLPTGVTLDTNGNLYVVDAGANTVRKVAPVGNNWVVTTIAGSAGFSGSGSNDGTNSSAQFNTPYGIAADGAGNLYVADDNNNTIRKVTPIGTNWVVTTIAGTANINGGPLDGTNGAAQFSKPYGVAVDAAGNVYVADSGNNTIREITPVGTNWVVTTIAGNTNNPFGGYNDGTNLNAEFNQPFALAFDASGNLFVADSGNSTIRKMTPMGTNWVVTTIAGTHLVNGADDGTNSNALFYFPYGIAVDASNNVYVADSYNNTIRKISPVGTNWVTTTLAGVPGTGGAGFANGTGFRAKFSHPWGIAVDTAGNLYVADTSNDLIREGISATLINLTIGLTATNSVVVSWWPGAFATLQTNASLTSSNWGNYVGTVVGSNGTNSVNLPAAGGTMFFQLSY